MKRQSTTAIAGARRRELSSLDEDAPDVPVPEEVEQLDEHDWDELERPTESPVSAASPKAGLVKE